MATIEDIAKKADVSIATVSRALNNSNIVSPNTIDVVKKVADELGYVHRAVRPGRKPLQRKGISTGAIAFLSIGSITPCTMYSMPCLPLYLEGIHRGVENLGLSFVLAHSHGEKHVPQILARRQVDGVILHCFDPLSAVLEDVFKQIPAVWGFRANRDISGRHDHVVYNNEAVGHIAAGYLLGQGCRHLFFASHDSRHVAFVDRREKFLQMADGKGVETSVVEWTHGPHPACRINIAHELVNRIAKLSSPRKIGIFCVSDDLLLPVFHALRQRGLEPGRDVEVVGCNNDPVMMMQLNPRPATIDIKLDVVGERAVEHLFWRISHRDEQPPMELRIQPELVPSELPR